MVASFVIILTVILVICFAGIILFGAPYLPTLSPQVEAALDLADLKSGQTLLELGCGDGKVLLAAARRGLNVVGYELNPILALVSWFRTRRFRSQVKVIWGNFWRTDWPMADAVFVFLLDRYMDKLNNKCVQYPHKPLKLVSFAFSLSSRQPDKVLNGVFLYIYK